MGPGKVEFCVMHTNEISTGARPYSEQASEQKCCPSSESLSETSSGGQRIQLEPDVDRKSA